MAIFTRDLENINELNQINSKKNIKSELLQFINFQNESNDYDYQDIRFELDINFYEHSNNNKNIFRKLKNLNNVQNENLFNVFYKSSRYNSLIFSAFERLVYAVKEEENMFAANMERISEHLKHSKKNRFDLLHNFADKLRNVFQVTDEVLLNNNNFSTTALNLKYIRNDILNMNINHNISTSSVSIPFSDGSIAVNIPNSIKIESLFNNFIKQNQNFSNNGLTFLKNFVGFNFIEISQDNKIKNNDKLLSLMSITTAINNILDYSFDKASLNSIFKGIYTNKELNNKFSFVNITNEPCLESDISKEILPLKYFNTESLDKDFVNSKITEYNNIVLNLPNIKKLSNNQEIIPNNIFYHEKFLCNVANNSSKILSNRINYQKKYQINEVDLLPSAKLFETLFEYTKPSYPSSDSYNQNSLVSINDKSINNYMEVLVLIANSVKTARIKPTYGLIKSENLLEHIKTRNPLSKIVKGLFSYQFEDNSSNFTAQIIKSRLLYNKIVKTYKKYKISNTRENLIKTFSDELYVNEFLARNIINYDNTTNLSTIFQQQENILSFKSQKFNKNLIINNFNNEFKGILGESNADDFIQAQSDNLLSNVLNVNRNVNFNSINLDLSAGSERLQGSPLYKDFDEHFKKIKQLSNEYFNDNLNEFKNTSTFLKSIQKICADNFDWHLRKDSNNNNTLHSSARADLLNNTSILWLFNDSCKEMNENDKKSFQNKFASYLMCYLLIKDINNDQVKEKYNKSIDKFMNEEGPTSDSITEIAPFFCFFNNETQNIIERPFDNIYYKNTSQNEFETNGRSEHFLSIPNLLFEKNLDISYNVPHKLYSNSNLPMNDDDNNIKRNIMLTGVNKWSKWSSADINLYPPKDVNFIPQLVLKKINNKFKYFIYNYAHIKDFNNIETTNFDFIKLLSNEYIIKSLLNPESALQEFNNKIEKYTYNFETKNDFLNVMTFKNYYRNIVSNDALENNIFYKLVSLIKDIIVSIPQLQILTGIRTQFIDFDAIYNAISNRTDNPDLIEIKNILINILTVTSSIYCKMFNSLQSYTNLADRISESNFFFENSEDIQRSIGLINNSEEEISRFLGNLSPSQLKSYANSLYIKKSNLFLQKIISKNVNDVPVYFEVEEIKNLSFASKKFAYLLKEIFGLQNKEIFMILDHISTKKLLFSNEYYTNENPVFGRYKDMNETFVEATSYNVLTENQAKNFLNFKRTQLLENMENPFEIFNLYNANLFQLIPGVKNQKTIQTSLDVNNSMQIDQANYVLLLSNNLSILNLFKCGEDVYFKQFEESGFFNFNIGIDQRNRNIFINYREFERMHEKWQALSLASMELTEKSDEEDLDYSYINRESDNTFRGNTKVITSNLSTTDFGSNFVYGYSYRTVESALLPVQEEVQSNSISVVEIANNLSANDENRIDLNDVIYLKVSDYNHSGEAYLNKKNFFLKSNINATNIFHDIVNFSFDTDLSYNINESSNEFERSSGLSDIYSYPDFLGVKNIGNNYLSKYESLFAQKYVDFNFNWYNHVMHGLITNDLGLSMSYDFLLYYYKNFLDDFKFYYQQIVDKRNRFINIDSHDLSVSRAIDVLKNFNNSNNANYLNNNELFEIAIDNNRLQKNYLKSFIKTKAIKNIVNPQNFIFFLPNNLSTHIEKIISLNTNEINNNGDFLMSYFDDFYIKKLWEKSKIKNESGNFVYDMKDIMKNYEYNYLSGFYLFLIDEEPNIVNNQSKDLLGSHILSVGIDNKHKLDRDDIVLIKVEMIDHDFPDLVWEPKIFEFFSSFEDIENVFFQHSSLLSTDNANINENNPPIMINSFYSDYTLDEVSLSNFQSLKDTMVRKENTFFNNLNLGNNIGSVNYVGNTSYLNPFLTLHNENDIINALLEVNSNFIESKIPYELRDILSTIEKEMIVKQLIKRCVHNQKINLKLRKTNKLLNGFEPTIESIPLKSGTIQNQLMSNYDLIVLDKIYDLFISDYVSENSEFNNINEMYPFTYEELLTAVFKNTYTLKLNTDLVLSSYTDLKFHSLKLTNNIKLNNYLYFLDKFTRSILPDVQTLISPEFQKIYNLSVNPKDFIIAGLEGQNNNFIPSSTELKFIEVYNNVLIHNDAGELITKKILIDEMYTEPNLILRLISENTPEIDNVSYYRVFKNDSTQYVPKNVSYRITTTVLE